MLSKQINYKAMKILITIIGLILIVFPINASCQSGSIWYFGGGDATGNPTNDAAGLDFTTSPPSALPGNEGQLISFEGNATLSDNYGNLFFYTDGSSVFDKTHTVMPNGTGLFGNPSSTQSSIVAPVPGSFVEFYVFTNQSLNVGGSPSFHGLSYSKIDMTLAGNGTNSCPLGDVVTGVKNIPLADSTSEKTTIVPHSNGIDYWVVFQGSPWNQITSLLVTSAGVNVLPATPVISASPYWGGILGEMKSSPNGNYLALGQIVLRNPALPLPGAYVMESELQLLGFDPGTGALIPTNCFKLDSITAGTFGFYGVEFSSSGDYLYANNDPLAELYQFDMNAANISTSKINIGIGVQGSLQLAPNGKIYQARANNNSIDVINDPNLAGLGCGFVALGQTIGTGVCKTGLPNSPVSSILSSVFSNYIVNDTTICNGDSVSIGSLIKPNHTYAWSPALGLNDPTIANPLAAPSVTTTYYLLAEYRCDTILDSVVVNVNPTPTAQYTYSNPCESNIVYFTDISLNNGGNIVSWDWDFGDGSFSTNQNPIHYYDATPSDYVVTLTVANGNGCIDSIANTIHIEPVIGLDFIANNTCSGDLTQFISSVLTPVQISSWLWNFGDGSTDSIENPYHLYINPGSYVVSLIATDVNGCMEYINHTVSVTTTPVANFSVTQTSLYNCGNGEFLFEDYSTNQVGSIDLWVWNFNDGTLPDTIFAPDNPDILHYFDHSGHFNVILNVYTAGGCVDSDTALIVITNANYTPDFTWENLVCDTVQFIDVTVPPPGYNSVMWIWDFDDGDSSDLQNPVHVFPSNIVPGGVIYNVTFTAVIDSVGYLCAKSTTMPVLIPPNPDIFYTFTPDPSCLGDTTYFYGESGFPIETWHWDFDDGDFSLDQYATHMYADTGTYNVVLTITDTIGCSSSLGNTVVVVGVPGVSFTMSDSILCPGSILSLFGTGDSSIAIWYWEFGDGSFSYDQNPIHYYQSGGTYTISLTAIDSMGCSTVVTDDVIVLPGPTADYSYIETSCATVAFTDESTAPPGYNIVEWDWDFDDGFTSTLQNPIHNFTSNVGLYNVTLIVTADSAGFSCTDTITQSVITQILPSVFFIWDPEPTMQGDETNFYGSSGNTIVDWYWDFDDGNFALTQNATHVFTTAGTYNVKLTITDIYGCSNSVIHQVNIVNIPELEYHWNYACENEEIQFYIDSPPTDIPSIVSWSWDFGDGGVSSGMEPIHTYTAAETYYVSLSIVDTLGAYITVVKEIVVNPPPISLFNIEPPTCAGNEVQFQNYSSTYTGFITEWYWDFGDGTDTTVFFPDDPNVTHIFTNTGTYNITLMVTNSDSCTNNSTKQVTIIPSPTAIFTTTGGCANNPIGFTDTSIENGGGIIVEWLWTFDDPGSGLENTSNLQNPQHIFSLSGDYDVTLTVSNLNGCSNTVANTVSITEEPDLEYTYEGTCFGDETQFLIDELVTNTGEIQSYLWSFGDGVYSALQNPIHTYSTLGDYTVVLYILTTNGCTASVSHIVRINPLPNANFTYESPTCLNEAVEFTDLSTSLNGLIVMWHWDFGDGTEITINAPDSPDVSHLYSLDDTYYVSLTVTDEEGCEKELIKPVEIIASPFANFAFEETCFGVPVLFTDISTTASGAEIFAWEWYFGDPGSGVQNTSTLQNPSHLYTEPGTFTTTLVIISSIGCSDTTYKEIIVDPPPDVEFTIEDDSLCLGEQANFTGIGTNISTWYWDFGDGGSSVNQSPSYLYALSGTYTVVLTVTDMSSEQCQNSVSHIVIVNDPPTAHFDYENNCIGDSTHFTDLSYSQTGFIVGWEWDFGDGGTSTEEDPIHYFADNIDYEVTLISFDNFGCADTTTQTIHIHIGPVPSFSFDQVCEPEGQVNFFDESEAGAEGSPIIGWSWNLYEGYYSTEIDPSYIYPQTDTCYTVILEVTDDNGCSTSDTNDLICLHGTVDINFTSTKACLGKNTFFEASYSPQNDSIDSYTWNFNDGSPPEVTYYDTISHIFSNPGMFMVELMAIDTNGCSKTVYREVFIDSLPQPNFSSTISYCDTPTQFTDESLGGGTAIESWYWDFGDITSGINNTSTQQHPEHLYGSVDSTYLVKLIITNINGCIDSIIKGVFVEPCLIADIGLPTGLNCARYELCFTDASQVSSNNGGISQWLWDYGDGNTYTYNTSQNPICHTYGNAGDYDVQLIIVATINGTSYDDTVTKTLTVHPTPVAGITVLPNCLGDSTMYYDATNPNNEPLTMWHWDFGDQSNPNDTSIFQNPNYLYPAYGNYNAELKIMNQYSCRDSITETIQIYKPPRAAFSYEETCISYNTYFIDESVDDSSAIVRYYWNFGDTLTLKDISSKQYPKYIYNKTGNYTVELIIEDGNQCSDTITHDVEIYPIPTSAFVILDTVQQGQIYLENISEDATSYYWDFDYGQSSTETNPTHQYDLDGNYTIMLVSYNDFDCPDTTYRIYDLLFTNLFVPNAFVPSDFNSELRTFKPIGINLKHYKIEVYSTWGNLVFESTKLNNNGSPAEGWDGTYKNKDLPTGSYIWRISAVFKNDRIWKGTNNGDGNTATSGTVTLIR